MFIGSSILRKIASTFSINHSRPPNHSLSETIYSFFLLFVMIGLMPTAALAQQGDISLDSFRILNTTTDFVEIEIVGSNDGSSSEQLWLGATAKSRDGAVRSKNTQTFDIPTDKQFHIKSRVLRPNGLKSQQTDMLVVMIYQSGKSAKLARKFDWTYMWPEQPEKAKVEVSENTNLVTEQPWRAFYQNLEEEEFGALDMLMQKWNTPTERDSNGKWKLDSYRTVFVSYSSGKRDWKADLQQIRKWREFNPKSVGAAIAEAKYWVAYAWNIRGDETSMDEDVDPVAIRIFGERMQRAEKVLIGSKDFASSSPLWYEAYLDIAVATKRDERFIEALFSEAIHKHPFFQPLYLDMTKYWVPRSGYKSDWVKADEVIRLAAENTSSMDGTGNYAMLYAQISYLQKYEFDIFQDSKVSWGKMRDSFEGWVERYPSVDNLNEYAAFACRANDRDTFVKIRARIINRINPNKWPGNYSYDLCDHRFMQHS